MINHFFEFINRMFGDEFNERYKEQQIDNKHSFRILRFFLPYLKPHWASIVKAGICMLIGTALSPVSPLITMLIIDKALAGRNLSLLTLLCIASISLFLFSSIIGFIRSYLFLIIGQKVIFDVRLDFYKHIQRLPIEFFRKMKVGDLMSRIVNDVRSFRGLLANTFLSIIKNILLLPKFRPNKVGFSFFF